MGLLEQQFIALLAFVLLVATIATPALQQAAEDLSESIGDLVGGSSQTIQPGGVPEGLTEAEWADIQAQIAALQAAPAVGPQVTTELVNVPSLRLGKYTRAEFSTAGATLNAGDEAIRMGTVSVGGPIAAAAPVKTDGRVTYDRGPIEEWWIEADRGVEHGFTVAEAPAGVTDTLTVEVAVATALDLVLESSQAVAFYDGDVNVARYAGLYAFDANGTDLPAHMELAGDRIALVVDVSAATYPVTIDPTFNEDQAIYPVGNRAQDRFGSAIAVDMNAVAGPVAAVAIPGFDGFGQNTTSVAIFRESGGTWSFEDNLWMNVGAQTEISVAISDTVVAVGMPNDDQNGLSAGSVQIVEYSGGSWTYAGQLFECDTSNAPCSGGGLGGGAGYQFGYDIDFGLTSELFIGAPGSVGTGVNGGAVYIYRDLGSGYQLQTASDVAINQGPGAADAFGSSVDADVNGNFVIGAPDGTPASGTGNAGAGVVWWGEQNGSAFTGFDELAQTAVVGSGLGQDVTIAEDNTGRRIIGAANGSPTETQFWLWRVPAGTGPASNAENTIFSTYAGSPNTGEPSIDFDGLNLVFGITGTSITPAISARTWNSATLAFTSAPSAYNGTLGDGTGSALAIAGTDVIFGQPTTLVSTAFRDHDNAGLVRVKPLSDLGGVTEAFLNYNAINSLDEFGTSVAINGNVMAVGVMGNDNIDESAGAVYVFARVDASSPWTRADEINPPNTDAAGSFGFSVAVRGTRIAVGAPDGHSTLNSVASGVVYVFDETLPGEWNQLGGVLDTTAGVPDLGSDAGHAVGFGLTEDEVLWSIPGYNDGSGDRGWIYHANWGGASWSAPDFAHFTTGFSGWDGFGKSFETYTNGTETWLAVGDPDYCCGNISGRGWLFYRSSGTARFEDGTWDLNGSSGANAVGWTNSRLGTDIAINSDRVVLTGINGEISVWNYSGTEIDFADGSGGPASVELTEERLFVHHTGAASIDAYDLPLTASFPTPDDVFEPAVPEVSAASALAVDGSSVALGLADLDPSGASDAGGVFTFEVPPEVIGEPSVDIDRNWAAVGLPALDRVLVLRHNGTSWVQMQQIDGPADTSYGAAVSIRRRILVVGAPGDDTLGTNAGAAYHYRRTNSTTFSALAGDGNFTDTGGSVDAGDMFGFSIATGTHPVIVGAPGDETDGADGGAVHIYEPTNSNSTPPSLTFTRYDGLAGSQLGYSVDVARHGVAGTRVAIAGAPGTASDAGAIQVYTDTSGYAAQTLDASATPTLSSGDRFGESVAIAYTGFNRAVGVVGAPGVDQAYFLDLDSFGSGTADFNAALVAATVGASYGGAVAVSGDTLAVLDDDAFHTFTTNGGSLNDGVIEARSYVGSQTTSLPFDDIAIEGGLALAVHGGGWTDFSDPSIVGAIPDTSAGNSEATKVFSPTPADNDHFGYSVEIEGDTMMVGVRRAQGDVGNFGAIHVYKHNGTTWVHDQELLRPTAIENREGWGEYISLAGNTMVAMLNATTPTLVWATRADANSPFVVDTNYITVPAGGRSIATDGQTIVVGRPGTGAEIYTGGGSGWSLNTPQFIANVDNNFGRSVDVEGDMVVIGQAPFSQSLPADHGSVQVWTRPDAVSPYSLLHSVTGGLHPGNTMSAEFGASVDLDGDTLVVGAPYDLNRAGQAYIYDCPSGSGCTFTQNATNVGGEFGVDVQLSGDLMLVSSRLGGNGPLSGQAYLYRRANGTWYGTTSTFDLPDAESVDEAYRIGLNDSWVVMAAPDEDQMGAQAGSVYVWATPPANKIVDPAGQGTTYPWTTDGDRFGIDSDYGDDQLIVASGDYAAGVFIPSPDGVWYQAQELTAPGNPFGGGIVSIDGDTAVLRGTNPNFYRRSGNTWTFNSAPSGGDWDSIEVDGDIAVRNRNGGLLVYRDQVGTWTQVIDRPTYRTDATVSGDLVAVTQLALAGGNCCGILIYEDDGVSLNQVLNPLIPNAQAAAISDAAISGDIVVVSTSTGIRVYDRGSGWAETILPVPDTTAASVAFDGTHLLVGSPSTGNGGDVWHWTYDGSSFTQQANIVAPDAAPDDEFGHKVSIEAGVALVAAPGDDNSRGNEAGSVYLFNLSAPVLPDDPQLVHALGLGTGQAASVGVAPNGVAITQLDARVIGATQDNASTLAASPLGSTQLEDSALASLTLGDTPIPDVVAGNPHLENIPLINIDLETAAGGGWPEVLAGSDHANRPLQDVTFGDVLDAAPVNNVVRGRVVDLPLSALDVNGTPLSALPLSALALGDTPLSALPLSALGVDICVDIAPHVGLSCPGDLTELEGLSLTEASLRGAPLSALPLSALPLSALPLSALPLSALPLSALQLEDSPLSALPLSALPLSALPLSALPLSALPLSALPLSALPLSALQVGGTPLSALPLSALPLSALPLSALPLSALEVEGAPLSALPLSALPLSALAVADLPLSALPLSALDGSPWDWCAELAAIDAGFDCTNGVDVTNPIPGEQTTLAQLAVRGVPLSALPLSALPLSALTPSATPLSALPLSALPLSALPLSALPLSALDLSGTPLSALPVGSTQLADVPLSALDVQGSPLSALPLSALPLSALPLSALPLSALPLSALPLSALPLSALDIQGSPLSALPLSALDLQGSPLSALPLSALPLSALPLSALDCTRVNCEVDTIGDAYSNGALDPTLVTLDEVDMAGIRLGDLVPFFLSITVAELEAEIAAAALTLNDLPHLDDLTLGDLPGDDPIVANTELGELGESLYRLRYDAIVGAFIDPTTGAAYAPAIVENALRTAMGTNTMADVESYGDLTLGEAIDGNTGAQTFDLSELGPFQGLLNVQDVIDEAGAVLTGAVGGTLGGLTEEALGDLTLLDLIGIAAPEYDTMTTGQLLTELETNGNLLGMVLADLLSALVGLEDVAFGGVDFTDINARELPAGTVPDVAFRATFAMFNTTYNHGVEVTVELPATASYVPGSTAVAHDLGVLPGIHEPTVIGNIATWTFYGVSSGDGYEIDFLVRPEVSLGSTSLASTGRVVGTDVSVNAAAAVAIAEGLENNDYPATTLIAGDTVYLTYIATPTDIDVFEVVVQDNDRIAVQLSNLTSDLDLVIYGDPDNAAAGAALGGTSGEAPLIPIADPDAEEADSEVLADFPRLDQIDPNLQFLDISNSAGTVDESLVTDPLPAGTYYIQVHGANGATNVEPASLQVELLEAENRPPCSSLDDIVGGLPSGITPGTAPAVDPSDNTLFLINEQRLEQLYGPAGRADIVNSLAALVLYLNSNPALGLNPVVVPVENYAAVQTAYANWDDPVNVEDACDPEVANAVVQAIIGDVVDPLRDQIDHLVIVGGDDVIPMARLLDATSVANEYDYRHEFDDDLNGPTAGNSSAFTSVFWESRYLSDDPYGESAARSLGDRYLYVPDIAMGRLVEEPAEIASALDTFVSFNGTLDMGTAAVAGYDFLLDSSAQIAADLAAAGLVVDDELADGLNAGSVPWTRIDAEAVVLPATGSAADFISLNGHFDHFRALPAAGDQVPGFSDNFETSAIAGALPSTVLEGTVLFSAGCHGGLSVSDVQIGSTNLDWAQASAQADAIFVGNTGFGYGDTETVAYTERLMTLFAEEAVRPLQVVGAAAPSTLGQAFMTAKNRFIADTAVMSVYDEKALMEATFYGLPFYQVGLPAAAAPPAPTNTTLPDSTGTPALPVPVTAANDANVTPQGTFYSNPDADGDPQVISAPGRPVQPSTTADISVVNPVNSTELAEVAHGGLILDMDSEYFPGIDPVVAAVVFDESAEQPEPELGDVTFPAKPVTINTTSGTAGDRQSLVTATGQFSSDGLVQRLDDNIDVVVYYADPSETDYTPPTIGEVESTFEAGVFTATVAVSDDAVVDRVYLLIAEDPGTGTVDWVGLDLQPVGASGSWAGSIQLSGATEVEYLVQAKDEHGNVGFATNKATNFNDDGTSEPPPPPPIDVTVTVDPTNLDVASGWYTGAVDVVVTADPAEALTYSVDGAPPADLTGGGTFTITGDGIHSFVVTTADAEEIGDTIRIDATGSPIFTEGVPASSGVYDRTVGYFYDWQCSDTSLQTCTADVGGAPVEVGDPLPATLGLHVLTVTAVDAFGNSTVSTVNFEIVEALQVTVDSTNLDPGSGWYTGPVQITATAGTAINYTDDLVGGPLVSGGSFVVTDDGANIIVVSSAAGEMFNATIEIDTTGAPTFSESVPTTAGTYESGGGDFYAWSCDDPSLVSCDGSVGATPVLPGDPLPTTPGSYTLEVVGVDVLGNSATYTVPFEVVISLDVEVDDTFFDVGSGWYTGDVDITVVASSPISYTIDAGPTTTLPSGGTFTLSGDGTYVVDISTDAGETFIATIEIDTTGAPVVTVVTPVDGELYPDDHVLVYDWTCSDPSLVSCDGLLDGTTAVADGDPVTNTPGVYSLDVTGVDALSNSTTETVGFEIVEALVLDVSTANLHVGSGIYTGDVDVTVTGGAVITYSVDAGPDTAISSGATFTITGDGLHTFLVETTAGEMVGGSVVIDTMAPVVTEIVPVALTEYAHDAGLTYDWSCTDAHLVTCQGTVNATPVTIGQGLPTVPGGYTLEIEAIDEVGNVSDLSVYFTVAIVGAAEPQITEIVGPAVPIGEAALLDITFGDDDGGADSYTVDIDWGDLDEFETPGSSTTCTASSGAPTTGNPACEIDLEPTGAGPDGLITGEFAYAEPGVYVVTVTVTDGSGNTDTSVFEFAVVFDPDSNGRVAGAGWYWSGAEAYADEEPWGGPAFFGYRARYKHNEPTPRGKTRLHLLGEFFFKSTSYDYLVINDTIAIAEGSGKISGQTGYRFRVQGIDNGWLDFFQITIWDEATGDIVYDNGILYDEGDVVLLGGIRVRE